MEKSLLGAILCVIAVWAFSHFAKVDFQSGMFGTGGRLVIAPGIVGVELGASKSDQIVPHFRFDILNSPSDGFGFNPPAARGPISATLSGWRQFHYEFKPFEYAFSSVTFPIYFLLITLLALFPLARQAKNRTEQGNDGKPKTAMS